jgi:hypothetical protein
MPTATVQPGNAFRSASPSVPVAQTNCTSCGAVYPVSQAHTCATRAVNMGLARLRSGLGTRVEVQAELDDIAAAMRGFYMKAPDQVLRECAAYSARLSELYVLLHRVEGVDRQYTRLRTQQVEIYRDELREQWKTASRLIEVQRQDLMLLGGQA